MADKPGSVLNSHSSGTFVAKRLEQPTRIQRGPRHRIPIWSCSGRGLPCRLCCHSRGALLPHHFTLTLLPEQKPAIIGGIFLLHFPSAHAAQVLPGVLPCGARTFLRRVLRRGRDCLANSCCDYGAWRAEINKKPPGASRPRWLSQPLSEPHPPPFDTRSCVTRQ